MKHKLPTTKINKSSLAKDNRAMLAEIKRLRSVVQDLTAKNTELYLTNEELRNG